MVKRGGRKEWGGEWDGGSHRAWRCVVLRCVAFIWFVVLHSLAWFPFPLHSILLMPLQGLCLWLPEQTDWLNAIDVALGAECCATFLLPLVYVRVFLWALPTQFSSVQSACLVLPRGPLVLYAACPTHSVSQFIFNLSSLISTCF